MEQGQRRTTRLKISTHSRLHLTLLAMHNGEYRINGGLGFAIAAPSCELTFSNSTDFSINDQRTNPLVGNELDRLVTLLQTEQKRRGFPVAVDVAINDNINSDRKILQIIDGGLSEHSQAGQGLQPRF